MSWVEYGLVAILKFSNISPEMRQKYIAEIERLAAETKDLAPCITLDDIPREFEYQTGTRLPSFNTHIGQRKLFISELQFLTKYARDDTETFVIYAGAAPSNHTGFLSSLFPHVRFLLIDPNPFDIYEYPLPRICRDAKEFAESQDSICIMNSLYTGAISEDLRKELQGKYYLFISDIRTNMSEDMPDNLDIIWNLSQQFNWIMKLHPAASMLKYKHPWYDAPTLNVGTNAAYTIDFAESLEYGIDFVANFAARKLVYLPGKCNIQCWQGGKSTETRLITEYDWVANPRTGCNLAERESIAEYENKLFYYNMIRRGYGYHVNDANVVNLGFDHCGDCAIEYAAWCDYQRRFSTGDKKPNIREIQAHVKHLSRNTRRPLARETHGMMFQHLNPQLLHAYAQLYRQKIYKKIISGDVPRD